MGSSTQVEGSYVTPAFEHARVADAMRTGVLTCAPDTPLATVARMMATHHIHCVVVASPDADGTDGQPWGIVSDLDLVRAAGTIDDRTAGEVCATEVLSVDPGETLERAAQLMAEHENAHLVVVDRSLRVPVGVLSSLDVAGVIAWGRA